MKPIQLFKTLALALIFITACEVALADWTAAPASYSTNSAGPIDTSATSQDKAGPLQVNESSEYQVGVQVQNGVYSASAVPDWTRIYLDEYGDATGNWSGVHFQKNGAFAGGLFKRGDASLSEQAIEIWNRTKPVLMVNQDDTTEFAGQIKIRGGNPADGKVLTTDASGNATWVTPAVGTLQTGTVTLGAISTSYLPNVENPRGGGATAAQITASSCPGNKAMVGWHFVNAGDNFSNSNATYCR